MNKLHLYPLLVNQKHLLSFFSLKKSLQCCSHEYPYTIQRGNCHSFKRKLSDMVQNGNTQIHHWHSQTFTTWIHLVDFLICVQKNQRGEMEQEQKSGETGTTYSASKLLLNHSFQTFKTSLAEPTLVLTDLIVISLLSTQRCITFLVFIGLQSCLCSKFGRLT